MVKARSMSNKDFLKKVREDGLLFSVEKTYSDLIKDDELHVALLETQIALSKIRDIIGYWD